MRPIPEFVLLYQASLGSPTRVRAGEVNEWEKHPGVNVGFSERNEVMIASRPRHRERGDVT